ncbi:ABC transporter permease [Bacillus sp. CGMCC 1.16607]|uniref:ABC transporter permease n=1 Tax=Bacillus sp. CGMCC 1.16607 TaxID=3351842 RepID=UPI0036298B90
MNIVNKLTVRHLKENKRRTLVTIIGVIISVAMVTAVATLGVSFLDLMKRQTIADEGEWHIQFKNVNRDQIDEIKRDNATKELIIAHDRGYAKLKESENENKPYLFIKAYNEEGLKNFPITLIKGRLPKAKNEIALSEEIAMNAKVNYAIGDHIILNIGQRLLAGENHALTQNESLQRIEGKITESLMKEATETFTIVGVIGRPTWEPTWSPGYTVISYADKSLLDNEDKVDALVILKKVNGSLFQHAKDLAKREKIEKVNFNNNLLRYYGVTDNDKLRTTLYSLAGIIMGVIIIGSVALIYNAFAISVSERSRHLGMLSSVGATKKQKRNSVFFEGMIIGSISIPIGIIAGLIGIGVTFWFINSYIEGALGIAENLMVVVTPSSIFISCIVSIATIFISTYAPARKASKVSAIDAIRQTQDVKLSRRAVKTSKLIRRIFGIEAEIGLKNLKRNKKRYRATVFSLVISIVLFLSVSFFTNNLKKSLELSQENINYGINIFTTSAAKADEFKELARVKYVTNSSFVKRLQLNSWIDESMISEDLKETVKKDRDLLKNGKYPYYTVLHGLDDHSFEEYTKLVGVDLKKIKNPSSKLAIVINRISYQDPETGKYIETKAINSKPGQVLDLYSLNKDNGEEEFFNKVEISTLTDQIPLGDYTARLGGLDIVVSESTMNEWMTEQVEKEVYFNMYLNSSDPMGTQKEIEDLKITNMHVYNIYQAKQQDEQVILLMSVFTYGFIVLITLISVANIFNTISTSISLRKREFAMLKSVGMTPKGFRKMINYESIFYGVKALLYGLPLSFSVMYLIHLSLMNSFEYGFIFPWMSVLYVIFAIFSIVSVAMIYSINKVKKENIIDALKQENI